LILDFKMTRFARANQTTQKTPHAASSWSEMKQTKKSDSSLHKTRADSSKTKEQSLTSSVFRSKKNKLHASSYVKEKVNSVKSGLKGLSKSQETELTQFYQKDFKRENRRLNRVDQRESDKICFNCRESGHDMRNCPKMSKDMEHGTGICFKCGSTEHSMQQCHVRLPPGQFPYAKCFICKETGHLSKQCPDNARGLYPYGGCCNECGSVEHFRKDCTELMKKKGMEDLSVTSLSKNFYQSADAEESLIRKPKIKKQSGPKVVKF